MTDNDLSIKFGTDVGPLTQGVNAAKSEMDRLIQAIALLQKTVGAAARAANEMVAEMLGEFEATVRNMATMPAGAGRA